MMHPLLKSIGLTIEIPPGYRQIGRYQRKHRLSPWNNSFDSPWVHVKPGEWAYNLPRLNLDAFAVAPSKSDWFALRKAIPDAIKHHLRTLYHRANTGNQLRMHEEYPWLRG